MLIVPTEEARAGMKLAAPVQHPDQPEQVLLKGGYVLEGDVIGRLTDLGVATIFIEYPGLEELDRHLAPQLSPARQQAYQQIKKGIAAAQRGMLARVNYGDYCDTTHSLIETLLMQGKNPLFIDQMTRSGGDAVGHATAVAHLALLLGIRLENYLIDQRKRLPCNRAKEIVSLGVAGMLHDLGKIGLPPEAASAWETKPPEKAEDLDLYQSHVTRGYEEIHGEVEPTAAAAVLHHHQHFDGSGFPTIVHTDGTRSKMQGQRIHIFSRILMVSNLYDRLATAEKGARRSNVEVYYKMRTECAGWCDPVVVQMLQQIAPPFPPGSRVSLNDGTSAIVTQTCALDPFKPIVRRLSGEDFTMSGEAIDLGDDGAPKIIAIGRTRVEALLPQRAATEPAAGNAGIKPAVSPRLLAPAR
jgi:HD-GYP domain-containing protein (c-di-GMP phosphodiesterase class II)